MVECPKCQHQFSADFGMTSCPSCRHVMIVDINGNVQAEDSEEGFEEDFGQLSEQREDLNSNQMEELSDSASQASTMVVDQGLDEFQREQNFDSVSGKFAETVMEESGQEEEDSDLSSGSMEFESPEKEDSWGSSTEEEESVESGFMGSFNETRVMSPELSSDEKEWLENETTVQAPEEEDFSEVADYGNSEMSLAKDGLYFYDIRIAEIDSLSDREALKDVIEDSRFAWDAGEILNSIVNGVLEIKRMNAIKACVLVNRIKGLNVKVQWKQNVITQMDVD